MKTKRQMNASFVSIVEDVAKERARKKRQAEKARRLAKVVQAARAIFL